MTNTNVTLLWSKLETEVILACFEIFELLPEESLIEFGMLTQFIRLAIKVIQVSEILEISKEDMAVADCEDLTNILITCFVWLTNLASYQSGL